MFKKILVMALLVMAVILCAGCSNYDKELVKESGTKVIDLPPGEKLVNFAADRDYKYVVHRKRQADEVPEEYIVDRISYAVLDIQSRYVVIREH